MIKITLPDGSVREYEKGTSSLQIAQSISEGLARNVLAAKVNNEEKLHYMLPAGGVTGTLRNAYKTDNGLPFVWGKTGSLSNSHNQSGYLITRKGKKLLFSFMNNNYVRPTAEITREMVRIMTEIHNRY
jgi:D-alanyl-D-alanine carboxypeptidase/D-alanyl-D-alanine-endopeptidase (penicillin-binding protein 4)